VGYGYTARTGAVSFRPFVELQHNTVRAERGGIDPRTRDGTRTFWSLSTGARVFFGGGPMRIGSYGMLNPMTAATRPGTAVADTQHGGHQ
jgi:hypothetical protein